MQVSNIGQRLANIRAGATGFSASGFAISGPAASIGEGFAGPTGSEGKGGSSVLTPALGNRWGVFLTGLGEFTDVGSTPNAAGYNVDTGGFTLGADYRLTPNFAVGFTAGVIWNDRLSTYLYYDGEVARTNYQSHNVSGGVRISF